MVCMVVAHTALQGYRGLQGRGARGRCGEGVHVRIALAPADDFACLPPMAHCLPQVEWEAVLRPLACCLKALTLRNVPLASEARLARLLPSLLPHCRACVVVNDRASMADVSRSTQRGVFSRRASYDWAQCSSTC